MTGYHIFLKSSFQQAQCMNLVTDFRHGYEELYKCGLYFMDTILSLKLLGFVLLNLVVVIKRV